MKNAILFGFVSALVLSAGDPVQGQDWLRTSTSAGPLQYFWDVDRDGSVDTTISYRVVWSSGIPNQGTFTSDLQTGTAAELGGDPWLNPYAMQYGDETTAQFLSFGGNTADPDNGSSAYLVDRMQWMIEIEFRDAYTGDLKPLTENHFIVLGDLGAAAWYNDAGGYGDPGTYVDDQSTYVFQTFNGGIDGTAVPTSGWGVTGDVTPGFGGNVDPYADVSWNGSGFATDNVAFVERDGVSARHAQQWVNPNTTYDSFRLTVNTLESDRFQIGFVSVPEPSSAVLGLLSIAALFRRRR